MEKVPLPFPIGGLVSPRSPHKPSLTAVIQRFALARINLARAWRRVEGAPFLSPRVVAQNISRAPRLIVCGACETVGLLPGKKKDETAELAAKDECAVLNCGEPAVRHFARGKVEAALSDEKIRASKGSVGLCHNHYRDFKKATKEERKLDRAGWDA
jgi:hypothetical protein